MKVKHTTMERVGLPCFKQTFTFGQLHFTLERLVEAEGETVGAYYTDQTGQRWLVAVKE